MSCPGFADPFPRKVCVVVLRQNLFLVQPKRVEVFAVGVISSGSNPICNSVPRDVTAMATHLFHVKVIKVSDTRLVLQLRIITGEQPSFYCGKAFALMLLYDPIVNDVVRDAPLSREVSFDNTMDSDWLDEHVDEYIQSTSLDEVRNHPFTADLDGMSPKQRRDFFNSRRVPSARFTVTVTRPEWLAHLRKGMEWDTAAYDALE
jgi:hypothetical protein